MLCIFLNLNTFFNVTFHEKFPAVIEAATIYSFKKINKMKIWQIQSRDEHGEHGPSKKFSLKNHVTLSF